MNNFKPKCEEASETLRMMVGKEIKIEIDLWEAFKDPEVTPV